MNHYVATISPYHNHETFSLFNQILSKPSSLKCEVQAGFAYATLGGVEQFLSQIKDHCVWEKIPKKFVIGIHHAISEPSALELCRKVTQADVRVFLPKGRLNIEAFQDRPVYHPKVLAISDLPKRKLKMLHAGSANLTRSAIGSIPTNYEIGVTLCSQDLASKDSSHRFLDWWNDIWKKSRIVDRDFIRKYASLRQRFLERNPALQVNTEVASSIKEAICFFAEVGAGSGPSGRRHQIEFPESLARFFGDIVRERRNLILQHQNNIWKNRPLSYKKTTFNVEIWRLGMPTQTKGGDAISGRAILFKRTSHLDTFEFNVVDVGSQKFNQWVQKANLLGHLGRTHGSRGKEYR